MKSEYRDSNLEVYLSTWKRRIHIAFDKLTMSLKNRQEIINFIFSQWEKDNHNFNYEIVFQTLINSSQWKLYIKKKKKTQ